MKKLVIHIGYPKTATTSLQLNLFADLHKAGKIEYLNHLNDDTSCYLGKFYVKSILQSIVSDKNITKKEIDKELGSLSKIEKKISVISAETLSSLYPGFSFSLINSNAKQNAKKFKDAFSPYFDSIEVLVGIRAQKTLLRGCYKQWYNLITGENPKFCKIENWLKTNIFDTKETNNLGFNFHTLVNEYVNIFGANNTHILIHEDLKNDKTCYFEKLSRIFDFNTSFIEKSLTKEEQNASLHTSGGVATQNATVGQLITQPFRHIIRRHFNDYTFKVLKKTYHCIVPESISQKATSKKAIIRDLTTEEKELILEKYCESNLKLIELLNLDKNKMKKYGYI